MIQRRLIAVLGVAMLVAVAGTFMLVRQFDGTEAATTNATMALNVKSGAASCDGPTGQPTKCDVPLSGNFTLSVDVVDAPTAGHIGLGTQVVYGDLVYKSTTAATDEIVIDDCNYPGIAVRSINATDQKVNHGMTAGFPPTFTQCFFEGNIVELSINCASTEGAHEIELIPFSEDNTLGTGFKTDLATTVPAKILNSPLTINCASVPTPTTPAKAFGDVNDDGSVTSVDAALILQLNAGLVDSLVNEPSGDVNDDGDVTSVDSALILQCNAGFFDCEDFPV
ncbi:MAG: dockerin type I repeat-containing protein [Dehalococcoidia bacterium]|nr:dockerin type I repeat-containing protein [Dehalococcoidia bacterium]